MRPLHVSRSAGVAILVAACTAAPAMAQGINLGWDDCYLGSPVMMKTFACDTDVGPPFTLVASFVPGAEIQQAVGMSAVFDLCTMPFELPDWWRVGVGDCRQGAISATFDFTTGPFNCADPWQGQAVGGMSAQVAVQGPTRLRLLVACALTTPAALTEGTEHYAFKIHIQRTNTTSCSGCLTNGCMVLNEMRLTPGTGGGDVFYYSPANNYYVTWQGVNQSPPCPFVVPTHSATWGMLKSLYR